MQASKPKQDPAALMYDLKREADRERMKHHKQWSKNKQLDAGAQWDTAAPEGVSHIVVNVTRNTINGMIAVMLGQRPTITFEPAETDSPGLLFVKPDAAQRLAASLHQLAQDPQTPAEEAGPLGQITQQLLSGELFSYARLEPFLTSGALAPGDVITYNDAALADLLERAVWHAWDRDKWDWKIPELVRAALVLGHRDVIVDQDQQTGLPRLYPVLEKDSWIDPNPSCTDIDSAAYYIYAQVLGVEQAVALYPQAEKTIRENAADPRSATSDDGTSLSDRYTDIDWQRDIAVLYTLWQRHQDPDKYPGGIRQSVVVGGRTVYDGPCRYTDIPAARFKNITITDSAYSIGEPESMADVQSFINRVMSNMVDNTTWLRHDQLCMSQEVAADIGDRPLFSRPNDPLIVPQVLLEESRHAPVWSIPAPRIGQSHIALLQTAMGLFDNLTNQSSITRGAPNPSAVSGVAIGELQQAASNPLALRMVWMEKAVVRVCELASDMMVRGMPVEQWARVTDKYPPALIEKMLERAKGAHFNVRVRLSGNRGQRKEIDKNTALALSDRGKISDQSLLEKMELDNPELEQLKTQAQATRQAQQQMALAGRTPPA